MADGTVGRARIEEERRKKRSLTISDTVFRGLTVLGNGSASQGIADLYYAELEKFTTQVAVDDLDRELAESEEL